MGGQCAWAEAAQLAAEAAVWTYKLTKFKPFTGIDKNCFAGRIFRSANWSVYNKRREVGFEDGLASTLLVLIISERKFYVYHAGDTVALLYRNGELQHLTRTDRERAREHKRKPFRFDIIPDRIPSFLAIDAHFPEIKSVMATDGVADWVKDGRVEEYILFGVLWIHKKRSVTSAHAIFFSARENGSTDNCSLCLISCTGR